MAGGARGAGLKFLHPTTDWILLLALTVMGGSAFMLTKVALGGLPPTLVEAGCPAVACLLLQILGGNLATHQERNRAVPSKSDGRRMRQRCKPHLR